MEHPDSSKTAANPDHSTGWVSVRRIAPGARRRGVEIR
jgi:hypothetical protein